MKKLVRDKIPELIESKGKTADYYAAAVEEYEQRLIDKLFEEAGELKDSLGTMEVAEEIADVLEVVEAIVKYCRLDMADIIQIKEDKKQKRGGFDKRLVLRME